VCWATRIDWIYLHGFIKGFRAFFGIDAGKLYGDYTVIAFTYYLGKHQCLSCYVDIFIMIHFLLQASKV